MAGQPKHAVSAGILLYRLALAGLEVLLAHPGGPFYASQDEGVWGLPKVWPTPARTF